MGSISAQDNRKRSVSQSLTLGLFFTVLVTTTITILMGIAFISWRAEIALENQADEMVASLAEILEVPMWNLSAQTIEHIGVSFAQNTMVQGLVIRDNWGKMYYELYPPKDASVVSRAQNIYAEDRFVGSVEISTSSRANQEIKTQYLMAGVFTLLANLTMLVVATGFLLRVYLQRPLQQLSAIVNTFIAGNYESAIRQTGYGEFQSFVKVLNDMGEQITTQLHELEDHRHQLAKLVEQRTSELSRANVNLKAEIAARAQAEESLRVSEQRLGAFMNSATESFGIYDSELNLVEINKAGLAWWPAGTKKEALIGKNLAELAPNVKETGRYDLYMDVIRTGEPLYLADVIPHPKFGDIHLEVRGFSTGNGFGMITTDITERVRIEAVRRQAEEALRNSEAEYRSTLNNLLVGVVVHAGDTSVLLSNPQAHDILGLTGEQMEGKKAVDPAWSFVHPDLTRMKVEDYPVARVMSTREPLLDYIAGVNRPDREYVTWVNVNAIPLFAENDQLEKIIVNFIDITERKKMEQALQESERKTQTWIENSPVCTKIVDLDFNLQFMSASGIRELQIDDINEFYGKPYPLDFYPDSFKIPMTNNLKKAKETGETITQEAFVLDTFGNKLWYHSTVVPINDDKGKLDYILVVSLEITKRKRADEQIKASLQEKEVLLKEIHHRVKNNLAIVSSLLSFQADITPDERARTAFQESQNRIYAMARIHEHLYRSADLARIDMAQYVRGVAKHLAQSFGTRVIALQTDVVDVELDIDRATPCGLIINELVSNALKHAFPPDWQGADSGPTVRVGLRVYDGECELTVSDNGVGLPDDFQIKDVSHESLGLWLVNILSRQLKGNLRVDREGGSTFCLTFAVPEEGSPDDGERA